MSRMVQIRNVPDPLHRKLGIETYIHHQAILCDPNGIRGNKSLQTNAHWYRMPVTLAKIG